jgi:alpha-L-rhamnosidase
MAEIKGDLALKEEYAARAKRVKDAICQEFIHGTNVDNCGQGAMAAALFFNIVEGEQGAAIAKRLVETLQADGYKHSVGILGMNALLGALSKYGYSDIAYQSIARYDYPSYGYWKEHGATSFWEHWSERGYGGGSHNHHMYGTVLRWLIQDVCGIQNTGVAYETCALKPLFFNESCSASGKVQTPRGEISFAWEKTPTVFTAKIQLPENMNATLILPNGHTMYLTKSENIEINL